MFAQDFIKQLGLSLNLPNLALDNANVCRVVFDGHPVDFEKSPDSEELYFIAEVCALPACGREELFARLLQGNRYGIETADATLSIDPDTASVILHRKIDTVRMDYTSFEALLSGFYARLLHWKGVCEKSMTEGPASQNLPNTSGMLRA